MIQRMGRILRRKPDGRRARLVVVFVEGTVEDPATGAHTGFLREVNRGGRRGARVSLVVSTGRRLHLISRQ